MEELYKEEETEIEPNVLEKEEINIENEEINIEKKDIEAALQKLKIERV